MKNTAIRAMCAENTSYSPRLKTDVLFRMPDGAFDCKGSFDRAARFVQDEYLTNADTWRMFVEQFRSNVDDDDLGWRSEYWGKMMRGSVFTYQYTLDKQLYLALTETVLDMLTAQQPSGRFSTYSVEKEFDGWDLWGRKYILLGFEYFLDICKDSDLKQRIIKAICAHADYIMDHIGYESEGKKLITKCTRNWYGVNSSSILEPFMRLYNITGEKKYLDFSAYIVECGGASEENIFEAAYEDKLDPFEYKVVKAYEMMSCFEGLIEYYRVTGIEKYKVAAVNYAKRVMKTDITVIGSAGCTHELFDNSTENQLNLQYGGIVQETCVTVTWIKFCNQLLSLTGDSIFADCIEQSAYNAMLGAVNSEKIKGVLAGFPFDSYSPLLYGTRARSTGGYKVMKQGVYGCCACIGSAGTALIPLSSMMLSMDGVYVNLYIPGLYYPQTPGGKNFTIKLETSYPNGGSVKLTVTGAASEKFKIGVRIPSFSNTAKVSVNNSEVLCDGAGYCVIDREWADGDVIDIELDVRVRTFRTKGIDGSGAYHVALFKGPVVLARDARLGEQVDTVVNVAEDKDGFVEVKPSDSARFEVDMEYKIPMRDGSCITMVDYASAGKTWGRDSMMTAWLAEKDYWSVDFTKPVSLISRNTHNKKYCFADENGNLAGDIDKNIRQKFVFEKADNDFWRIRTEDGKYLTAPNDTPDTAVSFADKTESDAQLWKLDHFVQNRYCLISKLNGCHLYEKFGTPAYRMYAINNDADQKYFVKMLGFNLAVNAVFEIENI